MVSRARAAAPPGGLGRLGADALLLATAVLWGVTFVVQKHAVQALPPLAFVAARFAVSAAAVAPLALIERRNAPRPLERGEWGLALGCGLALFLGSSLQQAGLATTSATNGGFLTACYVVLTPFLVWGLSGAPPRALVFAASLVSILGAWLLATGGGPAAPPTIGDGLVLAGDVAWAISIVLTPMYLARAKRPLALALAQYVVCATLAALASEAAETTSLAALVAGAPWILFAGLVSGGIAYTLQIVAQGHTPPAEAALILSLESVFAALAGAALLGDRLTPTGMLGCALILTGATAVEVGPAVGCAARRVRRFSI